MSLLGDLEKIGKDEFQHQEDTVIFQQLNAVPCEHCNGSGVGLDWQTLQEIPDGCTRCNGAKFISPPSQPEPEIVMPIYPPINTSGTMINGIITSISITCLGSQYPYYTVNCGSGATSSSYSIRCNSFGTYEGISPIPSSELPYQYSTPKLKKSRNKTTKIQRERAQIIANAIETIEGRTAFAEAMTAPTMYQGIGRKLLMVDEMPQGALACYERDSYVWPFAIPKSGVQTSHFDLALSLIEEHDLIGAKVIMHPSWDRPSCHTAKHDCEHCQGSGVGFNMFTFQEIENGCTRCDGRGYITS